MKKLIHSKYIELIIYAVLFSLHSLLTIILYSLKLPRMRQSLWSTMGYGRDFITSTVLQGIITMSSVFFILFIIGLVLFLLSIGLFFWKKKRWGLFVAIFFQFAVSITILITQFAIKMFSTMAIILAILNFILMMVGFVLLLRKTKKIEQDKTQNIEEESKTNQLFKLILFIIETVSMVLVLALIFIPMFTKKSNIEPYPITSYTLVKALGTNSYELFASIIFILIMLLILACLLYYISTVSYFFQKGKAFVLKSKMSVYANVGATLFFFLLGYFVCFYFGTKKITATTMSYIPFILSLILLIVHSIMEGKLNLETEEKNNKRNEKLYKFEPLIYVLILTALMLVTLLVNIVEIHISLSSFMTKDVTLNGYQLLTKYSQLEGGFQILSFILFSFLLISGVLFVLSLSSYFAKYRDYYKVVKLNVISNVVFLLLLGLFGLYYKIAQKINEETLKSLLASVQINLPSDYTYKVSSQTIYVFVGSFIVLLIMIFRGQLNHQIADETILKLSKDSALPTKGQGGGGAGLSSMPQIEFDACPAFTELDAKLAEYKLDLEKRKQQAFSNLTLPNLVRFIVDYARECRLHLSYSLEDIATFVAGLGASRLAILQGMSGTGKTSLPKIFAEAILGNCEIVEVESSWRDKNELLGYYNEFSKCYTPKKFTQCLYKARLNSEIPTFIVLDEMNLSRIEYYFSDFLSLMEHEEDKREIKLLNIKLARIVEGEPHEYYGLTEGHTIKIPTNIWFIGTANRDESTFEISDKVYDRAQTMNFNKRAPKIHSFSQPLDQKFATYAQIAKLFEEAKANYSFDAEESQIIRQVEKLLAPYNISFGNRILKQMEDFVKIYCACFGDKNAVLNDAVEKILLSKVVSKLEFKIVENKEALALEFDKLGLTLCSAFIRRLNED